MLKNTVDNYGSVAKIFHWVIAILIIGMLIFGFILVNLDRANPHREDLISLHKSIGLTILMLIIVRLFWRFINIQPALPITTPWWERIAAKSAHFFLYLFIFVMICSGWSTSSFGGHPVIFWNWLNFSLPVVKNEALSKQAFTVHWLVAWILVTLVTLHVLGALKNHFWDKNYVLRRMLPGYKPPSIFRK